MIKRLITAIYLRFRGVDNITATLRKVASQLAAHQAHATSQVDTITAKMAGLRTEQSWLRMEVDKARRVEEKLLGLIA